MNEITLTAEEARLALDWFEELANAPGRGYSNYELLLAERLEKLR